MDVFQAALGVPVRSAELDYRDDVANARVLLDQEIESAQDGLSGLIALAQLDGGKASWYRFQVMYVTADGTGISYDYSWNPGSENIRVSWGDLEARTLSVSRFHLPRPDFYATGWGVTIGQVHDVSEIADLETLSLRFDEEPVQLPSMGP